MDTARYIVALLAVVSYPPGLLLWFAIHPFAPFWRRHFGVTWTYVILSVPTLALMVGLVVARRWLLAVDYGTSYPLIVAAALVALVGMRLAAKRRKQLSFDILAGVPELSPRAYPGQLLTQGVYSRIRHPRYVEVFLFTTAYALFANHLALYVLVALSVPTLWWIVQLEERELCARFGPAYEAYRDRVPGFIPRRTSAA